MLRGRVERRVRTGTLPCSGRCRTMCSVSAFRCPHRGHVVVSVNLAWNLRAGVQAAPASVWLRRARSPGGVPLSRYTARVASLLMVVMGRQSLRRSAAMLHSVNRQALHMMCRVWVYVDDRKGKVCPSKVTSVGAVHSHPRWAKVSSMKCMGPG